MAGALRDPSEVPGLGTRSHASRARRIGWRGSIGATVLLAVAVTVSLPATRQFLLAPFSREVVRNIAVLPFAKLAGDSTADYFADGVTEILMGQLSMISSMRVLAR
jgi:hypothetical protein